MSTTAESAAAKQQQGDGAEAEGGDQGPEFCEARHMAFIRGLMAKSDSFEHVVMEHLKVRPYIRSISIDRQIDRAIGSESILSDRRTINPNAHTYQMSAVYWALMGMALMGRDLEAEMELSKIVDWVLECQHPNGGCVGGCVCVRSMCMHDMDLTRLVSIFVGAASGATRATTPTSSTRSRRCRSWPSPGGSTASMERKLPPTSPHCSRCGGGSSWSGRCVVS